MATVLEKLRMVYNPKLPTILESLQTLVAYSAGDLRELGGEDEVQKGEFAHLRGQPILRFKAGTPTHQPLKVGVVLSGGQAPGGHNVIWGLLEALKKLNHRSTLYGFLDGPSGIINNKTIHLTEELVANYRNQGGFDMIGSGRTKIETPEQFEASLKTVQALELDGLVIIGGDDSNTNAAMLAEYFKAKNIQTSVVGVPKTIDGDLKSDFIEISFGFDTATKIYSQLIGNIMRDSLSAKKYWYFIKLMGRSASHIALECALQTHPNLTLITEENKSLTQTIDEIVNLIIKRSEAKKDYGVILIPEGLIEKMPEINNFPELERDPHGNVQVSKIETERLLIDLVTKELKKRNFKGKFSAQPLFFGYEGRSGLPSNFDCQYCYALGHLAALLINSKATGYICAVQNLTQPSEDWQVCGIPLISMIHLEDRNGKMKPVIQKALVDLEGRVYEAFTKQRDYWATHDDYQSPGPIQFFGPPDITEAITLTLDYEKEESELWCY